MNQQPGGLARRPRNCSTDFYAQVSTAFNPPDRHAPAGFILFANFSSSVSSATRARWLIVPYRSSAIAQTIFQRPPARWVARFYIVKGSGMSVQLLTMAVDGSTIAAVSDQQPYPVGRISSASVAAYFMADTNIDAQLLRHQSLTSAHTYDRRQPLL